MNTAASSHRDRERRITNVRQREGGSLPGPGTYGFERAQNSAAEMIAGDESRREDRAVCVCCTGRFLINRFGLSSEYTMIRRILVYQKLELGVYLGLGRGSLCGQALFPPTGRSSHAAH